MHGKYCNNSSGLVVYRSYISEASVSESSWHAYQEHDIGLHHYRAKHQDFLGLCERFQGKEIAATLGKLLLQ